MNVFQDIEIFLLLITFLIFWQLVLMINVYNLIRYFLHRQGIPIHPKTIWRTLREAHRAEKNVYKAEKEAKKEAEKESKEIQCPTCGRNTPLPANRCAWPECKAWLPDEPA